MSFKCGIIGLPNVGKSSLFNALIGLQKASSENYPFCTIEPNIGKVPIPDPRLNKLSLVNKSRSVINAQIEFVDIAGLVKGASSGEGLGNKFLSNIREVDALAHVVRCFENKDITHVHNKVDPLYDIEIIESELILSDLQRVESNIDKLTKFLKAGQKELLSEIEALKKIQINLSKGNIGLKDNLYSNKEKEILKKQGLLSTKPMMYVGNIDENSIMHGNNYSEIIKEIGKKKKTSVVFVSAKIESELNSITNSEEKLDLMKSLNIYSSGLDKFIIEGFKLLNLITFFTSGEKESKAWTIPNQTLAPKAASVIHSDFERGFISAEVTNSSDLIECGGNKEAKSNGMVRTEGKDYIIQDGDVILFRFNV